MMRIAFTLTTVVLFALVVACGGGKRVVVTKSGLSCAQQPTPTPRAVSVRRATPGAVVLGAAYADFGAVLSKYYQTKYRAAYDFCAISQEDSSASTGSIQWFKDGATRFRVDEALSVDGKQFAHTELAIMSSAEPRLAECSDNLGNYYSLLFGGPRGQALAKAYPQVKDYFALGATCINAELESQEDILTHGELSGLVPVELKNFEESPQVYAGDLAEKTATIASRDVTCFSYGADHENCFDADGVLVSSAGGGAAMRLTELRQDVSDSDFTPPYPVVASPEQCPGNSAWDRATPTNPAASLLSPSPGEYHDTLTKYFNVRSKVTYSFCFHGGESGPPPFSGTLTWTKDGTRAARFDLTENGGPVTSYFADRVNPTICTADASKYLRDHAGGDQLKTPGLQSLLNFKEACFPDSKSLDGHDSYEYDEYVLSRIWPVPNALAINLADWEHTDPLVRGMKYERTVAGRHATCFEFGGQCYGDDGVLLFAADGDRAILEATSISNDVNDADFQLPYELKQGTP